MFGNKFIYHEREVALVIFIQQVLSRCRLESRKQPFKQTRSTENKVAERIWPEVNQIINYPVKRAMNEIIKIDNTGIFDIEYRTFKFCLSWYNAPYYQKCCGSFCGSVELPSRTRSTRMDYYWNYGLHKTNVRNPRVFGPKYSGKCFDVWGTWGSINSQCQLPNRSFNSTHRLFTA